jgi:type IV secretory pathway TraG/TraD family ATPase VirD4
MSSIPPATPDIFAGVRLGTPYEVTDAYAIAVNLVDPAGAGLTRHDDGDHWRKTSCDFLTAGILQMLYTNPKKPKVLSEFADFLFPLDKENKTFLLEMIDGNLNPTIVETARRMLDRPSLERGSVMSAVQSYLDDAIGCDSSSKSMKA